MLAESLLHFVHVSTHFLRFFLPRFFLPNPQFWANLGSPLLPILKVYFLLSPSGVLFLSSYLSSSSSLGGTRQQRTPFHVHFLSPPVRPLRSLFSPFICSRCLPLLIVTPLID